jgi:hypothetical protein
MVTNGNAAMNRILIVISTLSIGLCAIAVIKAVQFHQHLTNSRITTVTLMNGVSSGYGLSRALRHFVWVFAKSSFPAMR